jgi:hypothetical protein
VSGDWFEDIVAARDRGLVDRFGRPWKDGIFNVDFEQMAALMVDADPRWLFCGTYAFEPTDSRASWVLVTAGLSSPFGLESEAELPADPSGASSGHGFELCIELPAFDPWAVTLLNGLLVYQLGVGYGLLQGIVLDNNHRLPLKPMGLLPAGPTAIAAVMTRPPIDFECNAVLRSGFYDLIELVGVTRNELAWSTKHGVQQLLALHEQHHRLVTHLDRQELPLSEQVELPAELAELF